MLEVAGALPSRLRPSHLLLLGSLVLPSLFAPSSPCEHERSARKGEGKGNGEENALVHSAPQVLFAQMPAVSRLLLRRLHTLEVSHHRLLALACEIEGQRGKVGKGRKGEDAPSWSSGKLPRAGGAPPVLRIVVEGRPKDIEAKDSG
jgi:hypothetical protein